MTDGQPALGWVSRVWREGTKLKADFVDMPDVIYEAIKKKLYKTVSVEILRDVQAGTRKLPWVLDAVALLGADQPAVGTLKDLEALFTARKPVMQARARVAFTRDIRFTNLEARKGMEKHEVDAAIKAALDAQKVEFTSELNKLKADNAAALAAEQDKTRKAEIARHRDAIKSKFETAVKAEAIKPAVREQFYKLTRVEDDAAVMAIKLEDADAYITEHTDKAALARKTQTQAGGADDEKDLTPDGIVSLRAKKLCYSRQQDPLKDSNYDRAVVEVLKSDKDLAQKYAHMPSA